MLIFTAKNKRLWMFLGWLTFAIGLTAMIIRTFRYQDSYSTSILAQNKSFLNAEREMAKVYQQVDELISLHAASANWELALRKLKIIRSGGRNHLYVMIDFEQTLFHYEGDIIRLTHDIFCLVKTVPQSYKDGAAKLYDALEEYPSMSQREKELSEEKWIYEYNLLLQGIPMNSSLIEQAVKTANLVIREGVAQMLRDLKDAAVPVLIVSAGLGDVVEAALKCHGLDTSNVHVISNFFKYSDGKITGFKSRYIHAFNKDQTILEEINFKHVKDLSGRTNVISISDTLGDTFIVDELFKNSTVVTILKIGSLNDHVKEKLPLYKYKYDVVTFNDDIVNVTNTVLQPVLHP